MQNQRPFWVHNLPITELGNCVKKFSQTARDDQRGGCWLSYIYVTYNYLTNDLWKATGKKKKKKGHKRCPGNTKI